MYKITLFFYKDRIVVKLSQKWWGVREAGVKHLLDTYLLCALVVITALAISCWRSSGSISKSPSTRIHTPCFSSLSLKRERETRELYGGAENSNKLKEEQEEQEDYSILQSCWNLSICISRQETHKGISRVFSEYRFPEAICSTMCCVEVVCQVLAL